MKIVCTGFGFGGYRKGDEVELLGESETHYKIPSMRRRIKGGEDEFFPINVDFLFVDKRGWAKVQTEFEKSWKKWPVGVYRRGRRINQKVSHPPWDYYCPPGRQAQLSVNHFCQV